MNYTDVDSELDLLGNLVLFPDNITSYLDLHDDVFTDPFTKELFGILKKGFYEGVKLTPQAIADLMTTDKSISVPAIKNMMRLSVQGVHDISASSLRVMFKKRKLAEQLEMALARLSDKPTADDALQDILDFMSDVELGKDRLRIKSVSEVFQNIQDNIKTPAPTIRSGLFALDKILEGGFIKGKSYSIAARKKVGKTALLGQIAVNVAKEEKRVLYIALEMGSEQIMHRMLSRFMEVNPVSFLTDTSHSQHFQEKFTQATRDFPKTLKFIDGAGMGFDELKALLTKEAGKIDCFILDYWQLVGGKQKNKSTSEHLDDIAQWLSDFARRNNILNITATQINQDGNTRGSEGIRLAYDMTMIVHKEEHDEYGRWIEMTDTRYTPFNNAGSKDMPVIMLNPKGVFFYDK
jgi:replicative DNA helicase